MSTPLLRREQLAPAPRMRRAVGEGYDVATMSGPRLPVTWPLVVAFVAFPVWWALGVSALVWPIVAVPMLVALIWRERTRAPVAFALWLAFTSWVLLSGFQLSSGTKIMTFCYRLALYVGAGVLFLYVYNLPRSRRLDAKVLRILTVFWMIVVAGGYLGILVGAHTFTSPFEHLVPHGLRTQPFVLELVHPVFAEVQTFLGFPVPRPAAPFAYTNEWGGNIAVLTMVAFAAIAAAGRGRRRRLIIAILVASLVPMVISLNRGMFLSLGVGIVYVTVRLAARGRVGALASLLGMVALVIAIVVVTPLGHLVAANLSSTHGHSNTTRLSVSHLAIEGANQSPVFGHGEPQAVTGPHATPAIGTQGQLWMLLYSNGYPATAFFIGFYLAALWQTRRPRNTAGVWLHAAPVVALAQIVVYGWLPVELQVVMVIAALAYRRCWRPGGQAGAGITGSAGASRGLAEPAGAGPPRALAGASP
jgi:polysaccharide biosynthesis protein PslJ